MDDDDRCDRARALVIDAVVVRKETNADSFAMRIQGSYPTSEAHTWEHRLHPARLFAILERDALREENDAKRDGISF